MDVKGHTIFFTGATSGLGKVAACELANKGAKIFATSRSVTKGDELLNYFKVKYSKAIGSIVIIDCNLSSFKSIERCCIKVKSLTDKLDIVINNAGLMNFEFKLTEDNIEETLQVNLLAPIYINQQFMHLLKQSEGSKIINTASALHSGTILFNDIEFNQKFSSYKSYSQSKLGVILMTRLIAKKLEKDNIGVYANHPGMVNTNLGRSAGWFAKLIFKLMSTSPENGAKTLLYLASTDKKELTTGEYYSNCKITKTSKNAYDLKLATKLSERIDKYLEKINKGE